MPEEFLSEKKALDIGSEIPLVEGVESDEELMLARDLVSALIKTIKAFRFYPTDNPALKGFRDQLFKKFQYFLNKYNIFSIKIGEYELSYKGKILYENRNVKTSLAFLLYKDGLRELRFTKDLEEWEVQGLIDAITQIGNINQLEDDIVTILWEKDFIHIGYIATDEFLEETPVFIPENIDQFRKKLVFKPVAHHVDVDLFEEEGEEGVSMDEILSRVVEEPSPFILNRNVYLLTQEEIEGLKKEVEAEIDPTSVFNITDILFEILALEKEREYYQIAANLILKIIDALITLGDFQKAAEILKRVYITIKTYEIKDWQTEIIRKLIIDAGDENRIERIGNTLQRDEKIDLEGLYNYLLLLQRNAIKPLVKLLGELKNSKTRRVFCDALSEIGKNTIELFILFLEDKRWFLIRNIIYILGRIGKEQTIPYIQKALNHPDHRVRREAVQALGLIGGPRAIALLQKAIEDVDIRIRTLAVINLGKVGKKGALLPLLEMIQSKEFPKKDPLEIKAFFDAIGMIGSNDAIPILRQLLERKGWFTRGKVDAIRIGAANALAMIGTSEAKAVLESGINSKDEAIKEACLQAIRRESI